MQNCTSCPKGHLSSEGEKLKKHIKIVHENFKNYECETCGKSFSAARSLKKHNHTVNEGHKNHKCEFCGKSFTGAPVVKQLVFFLDIFGRCENKLLSKIKKKFLKKKKN